MNVVTRRDVTPDVVSFMNTPPSISDDAYKATHKGDRGEEKVVFAFATHRVTLMVVVLRDTITN
jgi:hypothetical protein